MLGILWLSTRGARHLPRPLPIASTRTIRSGQRWHETAHTPHAVHAPSPEDRTDARVDDTGSPRKSRGHRPRYATILCRNPALTVIRKARAPLQTQHGDADAPQDPIDVVAAVPRQPSNITYNHDVVICLSKAFAGRLSDGMDRFLEQFVRRFCSEWAPRITMAVAVVDRLPIPDTAVGYNVGEGGDGMAFVVDREGELLPPSGWNGSALDDVDDDSAAPSRMRDLAPQKPASIVFRFADGGEQVDSSAVEVALANTTFTCSTPSVLFVRCFEKEQMFPFLHRSIRNHRFKSLTVTLPLGLGSSCQALEGGAATCSQPRERSMTMRIPLHPLTPPRTVSSSAGNVIRGLEGADSGASTELEESVARYFADRRLPLQTVDVWALVSPAGLASGLDDTVTPSRAVDASGDGLLSEKYRQAILDGATLHRVMSGGGGWGNKAGLLSIDSEVGFAAERLDDAQSSQQFFDEFDQDMPMTLPSFFRAVAKPGDRVQFFIAPLSVEGGAEGEVNAQPKRDSIDAGPGVRFGTVPSSADELPAAAADPAATDRSEVQCFHRRFGALSELGVGLMRGVSPASTSGRVVSSRTKIDVPLSLLGVGLPGAAEAWSANKKSSSTARKAKQDAERSPALDAPRPSIRTVALNLTLGESSIRRIDVHSPLEEKQEAAAEEAADPAVPPAPRFYKVPIPLAVMEEVKVRRVATRIDIDEALAGRVKVRKHAARSSVEKYPGLPRITKVRRCEIRKHGSYSTLDKYPRLARMRKLQAMRYDLHPFPKRRPALRRRVGRALRLSSPRAERRRLTVTRYGNRQPTPASRIRRFVKPWEGPLRVDDLWPGDADSMSRLEDLKPRVDASAVMASPSASSGSEGGGPSAWDLLQAEIDTPPKQSTKKAKIRVKEPRSRVEDPWPRVANMKLGADDLKPRVDVSAATASPATSGSDGGLSAWDLLQAEVDTPKQPSKNARSRVKESKSSVEDRWLRAEDLKPGGIEDVKPRGDAPAATTSPATSGFGREPTAWEQAQAQFDTR